MPEKKRQAPQPEADLKMRREPFYQVEEPGNDWLDRLVVFNQHFGRFVRDAIGVILLAFALITFLVLIGTDQGQSTQPAPWAQGTLVTPWVRLLMNWFGWGSYLVAFSVGLAGFAILRWDQGTISFGRFIAVELVLLLTLSLLAVIGGNSLDRATNGMDGGRIGWGLTFLVWKLAGNTWGTLILVALWFLFAMSAFNLWPRVERWLLQLAGEVPVGKPVINSVQHPDEPSAPVEEKKKPKKKPALPPEFRKSLRVPESRDSRPAEPPPRGENFPRLTILSNEQASRPDERTINQTAGMIEKTLSEFGIPATVIGFRIGPTVTQFAVQTRRGFSQSSRPSG